MVRNLFLRKTNGIGASGRKSNGLALRSIEIGTQINQLLVKGNATSSERITMTKFQMELEYFDYTNGDAESIKKEMKSFEKELEKIENNHKKKGFGYPIIERRSN